MPFVAVSVVAYNVHCFTKPREPTARAAKGFPPPFTETAFTARGGQRPAGPRQRETGVMRRMSHNGSQETLSTRSVALKTAHSLAATLALHHPGPLRLG
jgi:hypothetical protein